MKIKPIQPAVIKQKVTSSDWDYHESNTRMYSHGIHRYSGKFIPQIAKRAMEIISREGELILDPYCGSGTTLLEGLIAKRRVVGIDLNPIAVLISKSKISPIGQDVLDNELLALSSSIQQYETLSNFGLMENSDVDTTFLTDNRLEEPMFTKWFQPQVLQDLLYIEQEIGKISDDDVKQLALVSLSEILRRHSNAHSGYPNVMFDKKAPQKKRPGKNFITQFSKSIEGVSTLRDINVDWSMSDVIHGDATMMPLDDCCVDAIVTHPPYIGSVPYAEYGLLSLTWLGHDYKKLDSELTGGKRQRKDVVDRFRDGYGNMIRECYRVLKSGRYMFLMVGNPTVKGEVIDLTEMTIELAKQVGFSVVSTTERSGKNRRANKMNKETLIFLRKIK